MGRVAASSSSCFEEAGGAQQREVISLRLLSQERAGLMGSLGKKTEKEAKEGEGNPGQKQQKVLLLKGRSMDPPTCDLGLW